MQEKYDQLYKSTQATIIVILIGDTNVGKTNIVHKFVNNTPASKNISPTIGVQFNTKIVCLEDGTRIRAQIWDTAGQQQYRSITMAHYRKAAGALIVYDITKQKTFQSVKRWLNSVREQADENVVIMLVGNKMDLSERTVTTNDGKKLAKEQGILFQQTSALANQNIQNMFKTFFQEIQKKKKQTCIKEDKGMYLTPNSNKNINNCC